LEELPAGVESKNRYANVLPIPETRVHIRMVDGQALETVEQYINANYVKVTFLFLFPTLFLLFGKPVITGKNEDCHLINH